MIDEEKDDVVHQPTHQFIIETDEELHLVLLQKVVVAIGNKIS